MDKRAEYRKYLKNKYKDVPRDRMDRFTWTEEEARDMFSRAVKTGRQPKVSVPKRN